MDQQPSLPAEAPAGEPEAYAVDITLSTAGRFYTYLCPAPRPEVGSTLVVESERGTCLGFVALPPRPATPDELSSLPPILRRPTPDDLAQEERNREREELAERTCLRYIQQHGLEMKLVRVHYLLGATKAVFYFTADGRVDFRGLVKDLAAELRVRIEMRQIGVRDETKMVGGVGHCGRELCCATWLRNFMPVSIRMAKDQNLALNPQKVSGACGRLMCCLGYEHEVYVELKRGLPKVGKRVNTRQGPGRVASLETLNQRFVVELEDGRHVALGPEDLLPSREEDRLDEAGADNDRTEGDGPIDV